MTLLFFVVPMVAGAIAPLLPGPMRRYLGIYAAAVMASLFGLALAQAPASPGEGIMSFSYPWVPELGVNLSFILDGYSLLFVLLITGIGTLIFLYSQRYMGRHTHTLKFYCWMLIFAGSMLGLVTSANLIVLYLFWEMTTISSFFLIGLSDEVSRARRNAMRALLITVLGGLAMLAGFVLIYITLGTFELEEVLARASELRESPLLTPIVILVLLGAVTKSAIFPFHIWLPSAMVAPTPVSAYLHSATMVKAGIYLVARFSPVFAGIASWELTLVVLGLTTLIVGGLLALRQNDLKALLAYSTISQLGLMIALYGLGTELAAGAATMLLMSHAVFKGALFLVAGTIEYEIGTREVNSLEGLAYLMPALAGIAAVVVLSLGGIPPLSGFVSKEILLDASLNVPHSAHAFHWLATSVLVIGSAVTLAYSLKFLIGAFGGRYQGPRSFRPRVPNALVLVPGVLAVATVAIGIRPEFVDSWLISPAVESLVGHPYKVGLHLWGGFKLSLLLSIIAITLGIVAYNFRRQINHRVWSFMGRRLTHRGLAERGFQQGMDIMDHSVPRMYLWFQNGDLRRYISVVVLAAMALVVAALVRSGAPPFSRLVEGANLGVLDYALALFLAMGAGVLLFRRRPLEMVLALGFVGALVTAVFALYSAPDLALTQLVIELLMVVLLVLGISKMLKVFNVSASRRVLALQLTFSAAFGTMVTFLLLTVLATPQHPSIAPFFLENSEALAKAKNVVNTILVDFRGFDTLGEITVVGMAALAVFAMVRAVREGR